MEGVMAIVSRSAWIRLGLLSTAASLCAGPAFAQTPPAPPPPPDTSPQAPQTENQSPPTAPQDVANASDVIIITGTSRGRAAFNTPLAVTTLGEARLQKIAASSQADILNTVPTLKGDAGGGEVASNIFVRGLPSGGQYQFTPLMYDGLPVLSTFGLNSSAFDVYYHNDFGIDRLEFVQGGVSNLFGPGSVAGLINYISRTGSDNFRGTAQVEVAEKGRVRTDLAVSGPLGNNLYYAFSGFYRYDEGPVKTDLQTKGYQLRGNVRCPGSISTRICLACLSLSLPLSVERSSNVYRRDLYRSALPTSSAYARRSGARDCRANFVAECLHETRCQVAAARCGNSGTRLHRRRCHGAGLCEQLYRQA
jgi:outer membrane receptor protein involved in Fe transport